MRGRSRRRERDHRQGGLEHPAGRVPGSALLALLALPAALYPAAGAAEGDGTYVYDSSRERTPLVTAFPKYPYVARRDRIEGEALVCFTVNARGQVIRPSVRRSTHRIFEKPALKAIRASTFEPLEPGELGSGIKSCRTYRFRLDPVVAKNGD